MARRGAGHGETAPLTGRCLIRTCDELVPETHKCLEPSNGSSLINADESMPWDTDLPTILTAKPLREPSNSFPFSSRRARVELLKRKIETDRIMEQP